MTRVTRIVLPGIPQHVTQRGNRREQVFFEDSDYALYLDLLAEGAERAGVAVWGYCLMPDHVHIIAVPSDADGLWRMGNAFRVSRTTYGEVGNVGSGAGSVVGGVAGNCVSGAAGPCKR